MKYMSKNKQQEDSLECQAIHCLETKLFKFFCLPLNLTTTNSVDLAKRERIILSQFFGGDTPL